MQFNLHIAKTPEEIRNGLSGWQHLDEEEGMLFVLHERMPFWMPDMLFPVDMIWLDATFKVVAIAEHVQPCVEGRECPSYLPDAEFDYVLEVNAGWADRHDVFVGKHIMVPPNF